MFVMFSHRGDSQTQFPFHCLAFTSNCQDAAECGRADIRPDKMRQDELTDEHLINKREKKQHCEFMQREVYRNG